MLKLSDQNPLARLGSWSRTGERPCAFRSLLDSEARVTANQISVR